MYAPSFFQPDRAARLVDEVLTGYVVICCHSVRSSF